MVGTPLLRCPLPFFGLHPSYIPFVGAEFEKHRILQISESHYADGLDTEKYGIAYFSKWFDKECPEIEVALLEACRRESTLIVDQVIEVLEPKVIVFTSLDAGEQYRNHNGKHAHDKNVIYTSHPGRPWNSPQAALGGQTENRYSRKACGLFINSAKAETFPYMLKSGMEAVMIKAA